MGKLNKAFIMKTRNKRVLFYAFSNISERKKQQQKKTAKKKNDNPDFDMQSESKLITSN